ncbi:predicted protein, partial [Arabidopsis lyrata subsp. lyrata]
KTIEQALDCFHEQEKRSAAEESQSTPQTKASLRWRKSSPKTKAKESLTGYDTYNIEFKFEWAYKDYIPIQSPIDNKERC